MFSEYSLSGTLNKKYIYINLTRGGEPNKLFAIEKKKMKKLSKNYSLFFS